MDTFGASLTPAIRASFESSMLGAERATRVAAERRASAYAQLFLELAEAIAPGILEAYAADRPETWTPEQWRARIDDVLKMTRVNFSDQTELVQSLRDKLAAADRQFQAVYSALQSAVREIEQLRHVNLMKAMGKGPNSTTMPPDLPDAIQPSLLDTAVMPLPTPKRGPHLPADLRIEIPEPSQQEYQRKVFFIGLLGKTGRCYGRWLREMTALYCQVQDADVGTIKRLVKAALTQGWIEVVKSKTKWDGGMPDLIRLTPRGEELYRAIYGADPVESDLTRLLREHAPHGDDHAVLCAMAADAFEQLGGQVRVAPGPISVGQGVYQPDLRVELDEAMWLVECEQAKGTPEGRRRKWENAIGVQGKVYLVTPMAEVRDRLVEEILSLGRRCQVYASDIKSLQSASPERIWCVIRENNQGVILPAPD